MNSQPKPICGNWQ